jgi:signal transduction histidine kinase
VQNVSLLFTGAGLTLALTQAALSAFRARGSADRRTPLLQSILFILLAAFLAAPAGSPLRTAAFSLLPWAGGAALLGAGRTRGLAAWSLVNVSFLLVTMLAWALGFAATTPFAIFRLLALGALASVLSGALFRAWGRASFWPLAFLWLWMALAVLQRLFPELAEPLAPFADAPVVMLLLATGWREMMFYASAGAGTPPESLHARLAATESALAAQDRLSASAILALGAAHEFKNVLSHVKAAAQHGLSNPQVREESLRLVLENAEEGQRSAAEVLEEAARTGREQPQAIDAGRDLVPFIRMVRAAFRGEGILVETDIQQGTLFTARRREVEQVLLNLIRNSVSAYRRGATREARTVRLQARQDGGKVVLEVRDHAGGVSAEALHRLFSPSFSSTGSTGLGLYLSRSLALANDGTLDFEPTADGSIFRLSFAAAPGPGGGDTAAPRG